MMLNKKFLAVAIVILAMAFAAGIYTATRQSAELPNVSFIGLKGDHFDLSALKGKVVLVNFWATSCSVCVAEMPKMVQTYEKYRNQGLETVAVAMSYDPPDRVFAYAQQNKLPFRVALDIFGKVMDAFGGIRGTPTTLLVGRSGKIVRRFEGEPDFEKLGLLIENELAKG